MAPLGLAHLSHFIGFGHTLLRFLFCGMISGFLLVLGAGPAEGAEEYRGGCQFPGSSRPAFWGRFPSQVSPSSVRPMQGCRSRCYSATEFSPFSLVEGAHWNQKHGTLKPSSGSRPLSSSILAGPPEARFGVDTGLTSPAVGEGRCTEGSSGCSQAGDAGLRGCLLEEG